MSEVPGRVLIVDDDQMVQLVCARTLSHEGYQVETVSSAVEAREKLGGQGFDMIVLDLQMPELDGLSLLAEVRQHNIEVPILIITGSASVDNAAQAMRLGAQGMLLKPFSPETLRDTVADILRQRRRTRVHDRLKALRPVVRISQRLLAELDLQRLQDLIIKTVRTELNADRASLMLLDDDEAHLRIVALSGLPSGVRVGHRVPVGRSLAGWVATKRQPLFVDSRGQVSPPSPDIRGVLFEDNIVSALSVPLLAGDRLLGVLNAAKVHVGAPFTEDDQELLALLAAQAAIAIENARLYARVAASEERYRALLQHASDAVLLLDARGRTILDANLAMERLSGFEAASLRQLSPKRLLPDLPGWLDQARRPAEGAEIETSLCARSEQVVPVAISISSVPYNGHRLLLVIARDISERRRLARQLLQNEKLAALGRLSASMAHEINNPLQAINNSIHLLLTRALPEEKRQRYLEMTQEELTRLIDLVRRILDFYRPTREGVRPTSLNSLLETVLSLTESQLQHSKVTVAKEWQSDLPPVPAISNHIKQVYFSLIFNAIEAMPEGGQLHIRTYLAEEGMVDEGGFVTISGPGAGPRMQGRAAVVEFIDSGQGISADDLPKIFEPFYTTRLTGTGLGLAVSYSIIEQHHGEMAVRSTPGKGSVFRIKLPVVGGDEAQSGRSAV